MLLFAASSQNAAKYSKVNMAWGTIAVIAAAIARLNLLKKSR